METNLIKDVVVTNNLHKLMVRECAIRTLEGNLQKKFPMRDLDVVFAREFGMSRHSIMAIRQNKYQPKIEDAYKFALYFGITLEQFFNFDVKFDKGV